MIRALMALSLNLLAAGASAQTLWVYGTALQKSNVEGELAFAVMVDKSGYYEAALEVQGESAQDYTVVLELQAEREGTPVTTRFSFAGLDCG
jgi:hypothetical protein